ADHPARRRDPGRRRLGLHRPHPQGGRGHRQRGGHYGGSARADRHHHHARAPAERRRARHGASRHARGHPRSGRRAARPDLRSAGRSEDPRDPRLRRGARPAARFLRRPGGFDPCTRGPGRGGGRGPAARSGGAAGRPRPRQARPRTRRPRRGGAHRGGQLPAWPLLRLRGSLHDLARADRSRSRPARHRLAHRARRGLARCPDQRSDRLRGPQDHPRQRQAQPHPPLPGAILGLQSRRDRGLRPEGMRVDERPVTGRLIRPGKGRPARRKPGAPLSRLLGQATGAAVGAPAFALALGACVLLSRLGLGVAVLLLLQAFDGDGLVVSAALGLGICAALLSSLAELALWAGAVPVLAARMRGARVSAWGPVFGRGVELLFAPLLGLGLLRVLVWVLLQLASIGALLVLLAAILAGPISAMVVLLAFLLLVAADLLWRVAFWAAIARMGAWKENLATALVGGIL